MDRKQMGGTPCDHQSHWAPIDRYRPCFEIASGGMATLYLARVTARAGFDRFVALKRIHLHLVKEPGFVEMFLDEARVASCIVHPNVCSVFDYEGGGDRHYIAMEYLMGEPLSRVMHAMPSQVDAPSIERTCCMAARIIADACEGLHAAHELRDSEGELLKVVHRDVSPQNLFLTYDGAVKVVDFGLVRTAQCLHKTKTGIVKGKFGYLAPEALATKPLDRRADIWGLGVVLWEFVTQRPLFQRENDADTVLAVASAEVLPPSAVRPGVPAALDAIVQRALARDPAERYATARDLGRDLIRFVHEGAEPVGLSDLAEWMDRLFPSGRARKLQLLELAGQLGREVATLVNSPRAELAAFPTTEFSQATTRVMPSENPAASDRAPREPARRLRRAAAAMTGAVALVLAGACLSMLCVSARNGSSAPTGVMRAGMLSSTAPEGSPTATRDPDTEGRSCGPDRGTYMFEVVPLADGDPRHMLLRAVPRETARP